MIRLIAFAIIYGVMIFIWSFVYLNKSYNQVNQSFLYFLSSVILWMVLNICNDCNDMSAFGLVIKTVYWYSMLNLSLFFLLFVYRFVGRNLDRWFYGFVLFNMLTLLSRYLFPIDYSSPNFWRLSDPVVAPAMSTIFSLPVIFALFLIIQEFRITKDARKRTQLRYIFWGSGLACLVSVLSEYILPAVLHVETHLSLMYVAILIFAVCIFVSIVRHRLLNIQTEYIYRKLFLYSGNGIIIINKNQKIVSINNKAKTILQNDTVDSGDKITDYISEYAFESNYDQKEVAIRLGDQQRYLQLTQYPIDSSDQNSAKLMTITDVTAAKLELQQEKAQLIKKSYIDQLTGLYNKQYLAENGNLYGENQPGEALALLFMDVDNFKSINDDYGLLAGDDILKTLAACIKSSIRNDANAIRFGGDEFIVLLENASAGDAYQVAERIRKSAAQLDFSRYAPNLKLSLSIGFAEGLPPVGDLIVKADRAMYRSKTSGKDRTTAFSEIRA